MKAYVMKQIVIRNIDCLTCLLTFMYSYKSFRKVHCRSHTEQNLIRDSAEILYSKLALCVHPTSVYLLPVVS